MPADGVLAGKGLEQASTVRREGTGGEGRTCELGERAWRAAGEGVEVGRMVCGRLGCLR